MAESARQNVWGAELNKSSPHVDWLACCFPALRLLNARETMRTTSTVLQQMQCAWRMKQPLQRASVVGPQGAERCCRVSAAASRPCHAAALPWARSRSKPCMVGVDSKRLSSNHNV
jgi:hypothetical protein